MNKKNESYGEKLQKSGNIKSKEITNSKLKQSKKSRNKWRKSTIEGKKK